MSYQLQENNRRIDQDVKGFLEECDAQYAQKVSQAADAILTNLPHSPIVLLSGPSGSGKTTTALKIEEELEKRGVLSHTISMDNYFKTLDPKTAPRTADGLVDFESPKCMDMDLLNSHFAKLSKGETIVVPKFEFARQMRNDHLGTPLRLKKNEIAIFEGIHALNDECAGRNPAATCLYISARSDVLEGEALRMAKGRLRSAALLLFCFPGSPPVYYGDEAGMEGFEDPFNRRPYPWGREDGELLGWFKQLGALRKDYPALRRGTIRYVAAEGPLLAFARADDGEELLCVCNAGDAPVTLPLPGKTASPLAGTPALSPLEEDEGGQINLPPRSGAGLLMKK